MTDTRDQLHERESQVAPPVRSGGISELIARLEKATGPDRDLDGDIAVSMGLFARRPVVASPLAYTVSIDAARTLVSDGFYWLVSEGRTLPSEPLGGAQIYKPQSLVAPLSQSEHESAAIALCIAALRARVATAMTAQAEEQSPLSREPISKATGAAS